jgi:Flp pilus assembly protein TadG
MPGAIDEFQRSLKVLRHRMRGKEGGQDLIEFALVLPLLLVLSVGILDFSLAFMSWTALVNATREGARASVSRPLDLYTSSCASGDVPNSPATVLQVKARVQEFARGLNLATSDVTVTCAWPQTATTGAVTVEVYKTYTLLTGRMIGAFFGPGVGTLRFHASATMQHE